LEIAQKALFSIFISALKKSTNVDIEKNLPALNIQNAFYRNHRFLAALRALQQSLTPVSPFCSMIGCFG
jgi:hypothetical protein